MAWLTKKSWAKIAVAVALAAALFVLVGVGSCAVRTGYWLGDLYGGNPLGGEGYMNVTRIPMDDIKNVEIDWAAGSVEVVYGSGDEFSLIETSPNGLTRAQAMRCVVEGDTLKVSYGNGFTGCTGGRAKQLQVSMPRMEGLSLDGASGTYQVSGAVSERLVVSLASGQFKASGADVDVLSLNVASGDASFEGIVRESVQADARFRSHRRHVQSGVPEAVRRRFRQRHRHVVASRHRQGLRRAGGEGFRLLPERLRPGGFGRGSVPLQGRRRRRRHIRQRQPDERRVHPAENTVTLESQPRDILPIPLGWRNSASLLKERFHNPVEILSGSMWDDAEGVWIQLEKIIT